MSIDRDKPKPPLTPRRSQRKLNAQMRKEANMPIAVDILLPIYNQVCYKHLRRNCNPCFAEQDTKKVSIPSKPDVETPSYRALDYNPNPDDFQKPLRYIKAPKYRAPEYDATLIDRLLIDLINDELCYFESSLSFTTFTQEHLERIVDALETISFERKYVREEIKSLRKQKDFNLNKKCCICVQNQVTNLVRCRICDILVHLDCYRYCGDESRAQEAEWLCDWCENRQSLLGGMAVPKPKCVLCLKGDGAIKQTDQLGSWCHVVCFENHPNTSFDLRTFRVTGLDLINGWNLFSNETDECSICKEDSGATIRCMIDECDEFIHSSCSHQQIRQLFSLTEAEDASLDDIYTLRCTKHAWICWVQKSLEQQIILSTRFLAAIDKYLLIEGGLCIPPPVISLICQYWLLALNPEFPEHFLLSSLYIEQSMRIMEQEWEISSPKSMFLPKRNYSRIARSLSLRKSKTTAVPKKRLTCYASNRLAIRKALFNHNQLMSKQKTSPHLVSVTIPLFSVKAPEGSETYVFSKIDHNIQVIPKRAVTLFSPKINQKMANVQKRKAKAKTKTKKKVKSPKLPTPLSPNHGYQTRKSNRVTKMPWKIRVRELGYC